jgi:hypothetical protein
MEDFLPVLIGIIWVAITLYNKGKKKQNIKQSAATEIKDSKPLSVLEQILMGGVIKESKPFDIYYEPVAEKPIEYIEEKIKQKKPPTPFLNEELAQFSQEGQPVSAFLEDEMTIDEFLHALETEKTDMDFDLQKAVIYSEILNPPYIGYK